LSETLTVYVPLVSTRLNAAVWKLPVKKPPLSVESADPTRVEEASKMLTVEGGTLPSDEAEYAVSTFVMRVVWDRVKLGEAAHVGPVSLQPKKASGFQLLKMTSALAAGREASRSANPIQMVLIFI
jgi:hypothetical protein